MKIGEVCLHTNDVVRLANFYKALFNVDNGSNDTVHQYIINEDTNFTIYNDGGCKGAGCSNISIAFTVDDVDTEYERLKELGAEIITPPSVRPWGAKNMIFADPDGNRIVLRSFPKRENI